jgi:transposase-like protein/predicted nucleic-acid-binding Zn-ribbon protein
MKKALSISEFRNKFRTEEDCLNYLLEVKWGNGYKCIKCGCEDYVKGRQWFYRRCRKCKYDESVTANTMFHKCKLGLLRAFEIGFRISVKKKGMSTNELAKEFDCQQRSAWLLKAKFQNAMKSSNQYPLERQVEVDEFLIGGFDEDKQGRSPGAKQLVILGVEKVTDKDGKMTIGRAYAKVIENASAKQLGPFFEQKIDKDSKITTDGWRGYWPLQKDWSIKQILSEKGKGFPELHIHIMNIKAWLRGIHHKCKGTRLQNYLDEFHFRFNRRGFLNTVLDKLIERAVALSPVTYHGIKTCELNT